jgi:hypothetical protein
VKTAYSDAFERTTVLWGIDRYLYRDGVPESACTTPAPAKLSDADALSRELSNRERLGIVPQNGHFGSRGTHASFRAGRRRMRTR